VFIFWFKVVVFFTQWQRTVSTHRSLTLCTPLFLSPRCKQHVRHKPSSSEPNITITQSITTVISHKSSSYPDHFKSALNHGEREHEKENRIYQSKQVDHKSCTAYISRCCWKFSMVRTLRKQKTGGDAVHSLRGFRPTGVRQIC